ncbi:hypothetical protein [Petroclostridium sp. X23]|uniref:hypothetical protein n=1 Tax=Petroclostridium sp. X23 TaxID=3045146 RepID=UPI0024AD0A5B|nr:hypothetical protein [Petroclostridium sp. X23]WHH58432.1 hypothetical protein QKW49_21960 [Petroclostridium sp. X23]
MKATSDQLPMCCNCKYATKIPLTDDVVCPIQGVVSSSYLCRKYSYDFFFKKPKRRRNINTEEFSFSDFSIVDVDS